MLLYLWYFDQRKICDTSYNTWCEFAIEIFKQLDHNCIRHFGRTVGLSCFNRWSTNVGCPLGSSQLGFLKQVAITYPNKRKTLSYYSPEYLSRKHIKYNLYFSRDQYLNPFLKWFRTYSMNMLIEMCHRFLESIYLPRRN